MMAGSPFSMDHAPIIGAVEQISDTVQAITAPNPSPMTFTGTRSYILGADTVALIDPGPMSEAHFNAISAALEGRTLEAIVVTHSHLDHSPLAARFRDRTGVGVYGCARDLAQQSEISLDINDVGGGEGIDHAFRADHELGDGQRIEGTGWALEAIHTPGHLSDHMCFSDGTHLFSGDHVMGWATSMISPPEGNLTAFMASLEKLQDRPEKRYFPGHGQVVEDGPAIVRHLTAHRRGRETQILHALAGGSADIATVTAQIYRDVDVTLHRAAARNVLAHIIDLFARGIVVAQGEFGVDAVFELTPN